MTIDRTLPPAFKGRINFNAQHSPMGAFMSFTCGMFDKGGGIGAEIGKPANQNIYVGVKQGDRKSTRPLVCLPFARGMMAGAGAADYQVEQAAVALQSGVEVLSAEKVARHFGWATDAWVTEDFTFSVYTPFGAIPEPGVATAEAMREALIPAVVATLTVDNRKGKETKTAVFALDFGDPGTRVLEASETSTGAVGFAWRRSIGVLASCEQGSAGLFPFQRWSVAEALTDVNPIHGLGSCGGVAIEVPAGESRTVVISLGVYLDGIVTSGLEGRYLYTRHYTGLLDVLNAGLERATSLIARSVRLDARLAGSKLSADQQFMVAHSTRSYYGSTQLLEVAGEPVWVVNEGEYCMMNTLDLSVDQMFWELDHNPWVVRNLLDLFSHRYSYTDQVQGRDGRLLPGGVSFTHDMGVNNNFSPASYSSYELGHLTGCFSYMTAEQLCNYILMAASYVAKTADRVWLRENLPLIQGCMQSLINRGGDLGFVQFDSSRCMGGAEITTYDSLDHSLAQTRNNVYIAVKCWASYLGLALLLDASADTQGADQARRYAEKVAVSVVAEAGADGVIPAVFERDNPGHASRILPAAEALMYALYWERVGKPGAFATPAAKQLVEALRVHIGELLLDPEKRSLFPDGGIRLSSTSNNSWMSKIAIFQHVARELLGAKDDVAMRKILATADAAHVKWQTDGSTYWACSDQFVNGEAKGSRYYPRIITSALWLDEPGRPAAVAPSPVSARPVSV